MQQPNFLAPIPGKFGQLFYPHRYKILWGGRGAAKSTSVARALVILAHRYKHRILCCRELQASIKDSVHQLLKDQIYALGLASCFHITETSIISKVTGSEFIFKGMRHNYAEIKGTEGITIVWVEEAQFVSKASWEVLIPTIRTEGSEIWITFNPINEYDDTYQRFVVNPSPDAWVLNCSYRDNPWFSQTMEKERLWLLKTDPEAYQHVYEGGFLRINNALVYAGKYVVDTFDEPPYGTVFHHGADWGFSQDPTVLIRDWITGNAEDHTEKLWIDYEAYGVGVDFPELPALFDQVPTARTWPIKADGARPETISYMRRMGYNIEAAEKWEGCVEDGISHIKAFSEIHVHQRCKHVQQEFRLYSYKIDRVTGDILPVLVDKNNHCCDGIRYSLDGIIQNRGGLGVWMKL
ncbi:MAG TPA: PBSX family phage terminase large subunit [Candidatus Binatia bacterium]|nr:PBSX family phage terminase large subunit [Candidatus Binatia bacterium]